MKWRDESEWASVWKREREFRFDINSNLWENFIDCYVVVFIFMPFGMANVCAMKRRRRRHTHTHGRLLCRTIYCDTILFLSHRITLYIFSLFLFPFFLFILAFVLFVVFRAAWIVHRSVLNIRDSWNGRKCFVFGRSVGDKQNKNNWQHFGVSEFDSDRFVSDQKWKRNYWLTTTMLKIPNPNAGMRITIALWLQFFNSTVGLELVSCNAPTRRELMKFQIMASRSNSMANDDLHT